MSEGWKVEVEMLRLVREGGKIREGEVAGYFCLGRVEGFVALVRSAV